jgi:predicted HTH domain antitoxin
MNSVTIEIPEGFTHSFGSTPEEVARNAKLELAIEMYREGEWSTGRAAEFTDMGLLEFMDLLRDRKIEKPYTKEMVEQDFAYAGGHQ